MPIITPHTVRQPATGLEKATETQKYVNLRRSGQSRQYYESLYRWIHRNKAAAHRPPMVPERDR